MNHSICNWQQVVRVLRNKSRVWTRIKRKTSRKSKDEINGPITVINAANGSMAGT